MLYLQSLAGRARDSFCLVMVPLQNLCSTRSVRNYTGNIRYFSPSLACLPCVSFSFFFSYSSVDCAVFTQNAGNCTVDNVPYSIRRFVQVDNVLEGITIPTRKYCTVIIAPNPTGKLPVRKIYRVLLYCSALKHQEANTDSRV